jgi:HSP20 family protein
MEMTGPNFATLGTNLPSVNLKETDEKIEVNHNTLIISSEKEEEKEEIRNNENYYRKEFSYQSFSKSFNLLDYNMKITSVSITKTAYCMLILPKKKVARKKQQKLLLLNKKGFLLKFF